MPNTQSPVVAQSVALRNKMIASNKVNEANPYTTTNPTDLTIGLGRPTDIIARKKQTASNVYGQNHVYNVI